MEVDPVEVAQIMPEPVLIPRKEAKKLFEQVSPETRMMMDDLADWRARSERADIYFGGPT